MSDTRYGLIFGWVTIWFLVFLGMLIPLSRTPWPALALLVLCLGAAVIGWWRRSS